MFNYLKNTLRRKIHKKIARRITKEYPPRIDTFELQDIGKIEFANWENPLVKPVKIDNDMIAFFKQFIKEGDFAIDIGANIGDTTVPIALCTGVTGLTLGFDPNPFPFKILEKNAMLNKDKMRIIPIPCAISKEEEEFYFVSSEASFGNGGIATTTHSKHGKFIYPNKIKGVNLEKLLEQDYKAWMPKFTFIKIDTEGYDKEILKSIPNLISKCKPVIIAESFGYSTNKEKEELYEIINKHGYDIYYFEDFSIKAKVEKLNDSKDLLKHKKTINIFAIPQK